MLLLALADLGLEPAGEIVAAVIAVLFQSIGVENKDVAGHHQLELVHGVFILRPENRRLA